MRIGIIGNYGATNIGDDAILKAILKSHSQHEWVVFSANPQKTAIDFSEFNGEAVPLFPFGFRSLLHFGFRRSLKALKSVDAVVLGGGGLFQDDVKTACKLWAWQIYWVKKYRKPLYIYSAGVGPLQTALGQKLAKGVFDYAKKITVRDEDSREWLYTIGVTNQNIEVTADPAFLLEPGASAASRVKNLYLVSLRPWLKYNDAIIENVSRSLLALKEKKNAKFIFVCMQKIKEHDHSVIDPVARRVGGEIYTPRDFSDLLSLMQTAEFAIGMRYHFLMAALLTHTPALALSYGPKVTALFKDTPLEHYLIPLHELTSEAMDPALRRLSVDYNNVKIHEKVRAETLKGLAQKNIDLLPKS